MSISRWRQASGMAAVSLAAAACGVEAGATVAAAQDCYGATYSLVDQLWPQIRREEASLSMRPTSTRLSARWWKNGRSR